VGLGSLVLSRLGTEAKPRPLMPPPPPSEMSNPITT
jgi:hypothetical protein